MPVEIGATPWVVVRGIPQRTGGLRLRVTTPGSRAQTVSDRELRALLAEQAVRARAGRPGATLPVFVALPSLTRPVWLDRLELGDRGWAWPPFRVVTLRGARWARRPHLALPLQVVGCGEYSAELLSAEDHPDLPSRTFQPVALRDLGRAFEQHDRDVVVCDVDQVPQALDTATRVALERRPRLIIGEPDGRPVDRVWLEALHVPPGVALAVGTTREHGWFANAVLAGIADDLPVHEAAHLASEQAFVVADPASNDGLRIEPAIVSLLDRGRVFATTPAESAVATLELRLDRDPEVPDAATELMREVQGATGSLNASTHELASVSERRITLPVDATVRRETGRWSARWSLLGQAGALRQELVRNEDTLGRLRQRVVADDVFVESIQRHRERRVDLALRAPPGEPPAVSHHALHPAERRILALQIGRLLDDSILAQRPPPIDLILPEPAQAEGHELDVTVFGLDFTVEGPPTRRLVLPEVSPSDLLEVAVGAPTEPMRDARLRVALYHRGHLLQSFLMTADVGAEGAAPTFVLEFSRSQRLTNLDDLGPRALSIAVNENPRAGHNLMIKTAGGALEVPFNANMVERTVTATRTLLEDMKRRLPGPSKQTVPDPPVRTTDKALLDWWRKLADHGQKAYRDLMAITGRSQERLLDAITRSDDQVVQIARLDPGFVYPWPLLYDWIVPARDIGQPPPDVCFGDPDADGRRRCTHGKGAGVICVYGFWAIRHQLDQVLTLGAARDPVRPVPQEPGAPQVRLAVGVTDKWTTQLQTALAGVGNVGTFGVTDTATLTEALWRPDWRAPTIAVVAHHVDRDRLGEPPGSRLQVGNGGMFLSWERIADALQSKLSWTAPNSVVLLMACESGQATTARLDDFATLFVRAGAGAVVATELDIGTDLAARCARDVTTDLLDGATFGAALLHFHRRLAHVGNPFGFSFCWIGDAGLEVAHAA